MKPLLYFEIPEFEIEVCKIGNLQQSRIQAYELGIASNDWDLAERQLQENFANNEEDILSHFAVKAAIFRHNLPLLLEKFVDCEKKILLAKLKQCLKKHALQGSLAQEGLHFKNPEKDEFMNNYSYLTWSCLKPKGSVQEITREHYFVIPFEHAPQLLSSRSALILKGNVWARIELIPEIVVELFGTHLKLQFKNYQKKIKSEQEEIDDLLERLPKINISEMPTNKRKRNDELSLSGPEDLIETAIPPCIAKIYAQFPTSGCKFKARQTLSLFYYNLNLDPEVSLAFIKKRLVTFMKWHNDYEYAFNSLLKPKTKSYSMTSCRNLQNFQEGGCAASYGQCRSSLQNLLSTNDFRFSSPVDYYQLASKQIKLRKQQNETPVRKITKSKLNPNFSSFINKDL